MKKCEVSIRRLAELSSAMDRSDAMEQDIQALIEQARKNERMAVVEEVTDLIKAAEDLKPQAAVLDLREAVLKLWRAKPDAPLFEGVDDANRH